LFVGLPTRAHADTGIDGAQAIAYLNQQRVANGIPPITTDDQNYAAAWCPDEDSGPSGGETWRDWSGSVSWSADASPWTDAPLHQISMYDPRMDTAGDINVNGQACMGLGGDANQPATGVTFYAFLWEGGHTNVPNSETVDGEGPFAPQQLVGIPEGQTTGPQPLLFLEGLGYSPHAISWSLTDANGTSVPNVEFTDSASAAAAGYSSYFLSQGGVMIPPVLKPDTTYNGTVVWQASGGGATAIQTFSFTTAVLSNDVTIDAEPQGDTVELSVSSDAPNPVVVITGRRTGTVAPDADGNATVRLPAGRWTACAVSGGAGTGYQAGRDCTSFNIHGSPRQTSGKGPHLTVRLARTGRRVSVDVKLAAGAAGTLSLSARDGNWTARLVRRGSRYTFTADRSGRWTIVVSFVGRAGWSSQKLTRTISAPYHSQKDAAMLRVWGRTEQKLALRAS
jgi:hypothetical protein